MAKEFKTLDEQLEILQSRGLTIDDSKKAKEFLLNNNYYRVSGYSLTLRDHDRFFKNTTFQNIIDIYCFDYEFRHILLKYIEKIEVTFKSIFAYEFARLYGPTAYNSSLKFTNPLEHLRIINKAENQKLQNLSHEAYLKHFVEELDEDIPIWAYVELFTISDISILYAIAHNELKENIATHYNLNKAIGITLLEKYMHGMTIIRNLCAHDSRLFNRLFITKPSLSKKEKKYLLLTKDNQPDNSRLFGYIINMSHLLNREDFVNMKIEISFLQHKYQFVDMKYYGFNPDWNNLL